MKRFLLICTALLVCVACLVTGWVMGTANHAASSNVLSAHLAMISADKHQSANEPIPSQLYLQLDAAILAMDSVLPLVIDYRKRRQIQETYLEAADFKARHHKQHFIESPPSGNDTWNQKVDAILADAKKSKSG